MRYAPAASQHCVGLTGATRLGFIDIFRDRVACTEAMLHRAANVGAQYVVQYLLVKGVTPDLQTL